MADLGPGTMPRGKYPESPAPAGSHALISRTPIPGGMLQPISGCHDPPSQLSATSPPAFSRHGCRRAGKFRNDDRGGRWEVAGRGAGIKKNHRHSGIFRVADLGPAMPRGKYPESPAPAGSHALISSADPGRHAPCQSRAATLPSQQPPLPQQPPKQTNSAATMSLPCSRFATAQPQRRWDAPPGGLVFPSEFRGDSFTCSTAPGLTVY